MSGGLTCLLLQLAADIVSPPSPEYCAQMITAVESSCQRINIISYHD